MMRDLMIIDREMVMYVFFGTLTALVNFVVYFFFQGFLGVNYLISNILAWFFSVLFAYVTNRIWVFESKSPNILKEMSLFFGGRIFSGAVDTALMYTFIDVVMIGNEISKITVQVIVVILNYVFSKLIVFKD